MWKLRVCLALLLTAPLATSAQESGSMLPRGTDAGDRLTVTTTSGERFTGRLVTDGNGALVLIVNEQERTIGPGDIERVTRRHNRFLFGPLVGLGAGVAIGLPAKRRFDNEGRDGDVILAWTVGVGVVVGSLIDALNGRERTIYARRPGVVRGLQVVPGAGAAEVRWAVKW